MNNNFFRLPKVTELQVYRDINYPITDSGVHLILNMRAVAFERILDETFGIMNWEKNTSIEQYEFGSVPATKTYRMKTELTVHYDGKTVTRTGYGKMVDTTADGETAEETLSLKQAARYFGIDRPLRGRDGNIIVPITFFSEDRLIPKGSASNEYNLLPEPMEVEAVAFEGEGTSSCTLSSFVVKNLRNGRTWTWDAKDTEPAEVVMPPTKEEDAPQEEPTEAPKKDKRKNSSKKKAKEKVEPSTEETKVVTEEVVAEESKAEPAAEAEILKEEAKAESKTDSKEEVKEESKGEEDFPVDNPLSYKFKDGKYAGKTLGEVKEMEEEGTFKLILRNLWNIEPEAPAREAIKKLGQELFGNK